MHKYSFEIFNSFVCIYVFLFNNTTYKGKHNKHLTHFRVFRNTFKKNDIYSDWEYFKLHTINNDLQKQELKVNDLRHLYNRQFNIFK